MDANNTGVITESVAPSSPHSAFTDKESSKASLKNQIEQPSLTAHAYIAISTVYALTHIDVSRNEQEGNSSRAIEIFPARLVIGSFRLQLRGALQHQQMS